MYGITAFLRVNLLRMNSCVQCDMYMIVLMNTADQGVLPFGAAKLLTTTSWTRHWVVPILLVL